MGTVSCYGTVYTSEMKTAFMNTTLTLVIVTPEESLRTPLAALPVQSSKSQPTVRFHRDNPASVIGNVPLDTEPITFQEKFSCLSWNLKQCF